MLFKTHKVKKKTKNVRFLREILKILIYFQRKIVILPHQIINKIKQIIHRVKLNFKKI